MLNDKNSLKINKNSKILICVTAILVILYCLSFTKSCSSQDKREKVKTALVNQKYKESINTILLQDSTGSLELTKYDDFWIISDNINNNSSFTIPASSERINNFLDELIKVRNLYKISDKINKNSSLGLNNGTEFHIRYNYGNDSFRELIFGNQDFSLSSRYMMTGENTQVYEIDSTMDVYLTTSIQSWTEPYIISRQIVPTNDIQRTNVSDTQKLLELRHGGLPSLTECEAIINQKPLTTIYLENGDKTSIKLEIFSSQNESSYIVKVSYFKPDSRTAFYTSSSKISSWTYNKIKEMTL